MLFLYLMGVWQNYMSLLKKKMDGFQRCTSPPWNEIKYQLHRSKNCQSIKSYHWNEEGRKLTFCGMSFQVHELPIVPRASWTPPHLGVQMLTLRNVAKPNLSPCWVFCFIIPFLFMIPPHFFR